MIQEEVSTALTAIQTNQTHSVIYEKNIDNSYKSKGRYKQLHKCF